MRTVTLEPVLDENPIVIVDGDGTVLDCNLSWTKLVSTRRKTGLRTSLHDVVSFVGTSGSPTAAHRELQVHHVAIRDVEVIGIPGGPISTALLMPIVHRRRDTYLCILLSPALFHPDAVRFAELLAMDASAAARADGEPQAASAAGETAEIDATELALPIELEGSLRGAARIVAALAGPAACASGELPAMLAEQLRSGIPGRRILLALRDTDRLGIPAGVAVVPPESDAMISWRPTAVWPAGAILSTVPGASSVPPNPDGTVARELGLAELPAWLQREFAGGAPDGIAPRYIVAEVQAPTGRGLLAVGPWRGTEVLAPDERLLVDVAALLLGQRLRTADRERALKAEAERLVQALRAERAALGRTAQGLEPVGLSPAMSAAVERGRALEGLGRAYAICGPAGAGRRTMARYLVAIGSRRDAPVAEVGCRFHDERWLREELFGGRATDPADGGEASSGRLALAAGGTLLVSDVDQLPRPLQAELLEALRRPRPGGAPPPVLVATLEEEPERAAQAGRLHPDLAALFGARVVTVPGLAERLEDLAALAARFVESAAGELGRKPPQLTPRALDRLRALPWRGHVRELRAAIEGAVALADGGLIDADRLPVDDGGAGPATSASPPPAIDLSVPFSELKERWVDHFERAYLDAALRRSAGNLSAAARLAKMDKKNFHAKAARLGLAGSASGGRNGSLKSGGRRSTMPPAPEAEPGEREDKT